MIQQKPDNFYATMSILFMKKSSFLLLIFLPQCIFTLFLSISQNIHPLEFILYNNQDTLPCILTDYASKLEQIPLLYTQYKPKKLILKTPSELSVPVRFFDRNSDILLFCGQGFTGYAKKMDLFAKIFPDYDIVIIDYRWNTWKFYYTWQTMRYPIQSFLLDEIEEVQTTLEYFKHRKDYREVVGLGICYSNAIFIMAHTQKPEKQYFTKLICDSCWFSIKDLAESITRDPMLPINPAVGGCPNFIKKILHAKLIRKSILTIGNFIIPEYCLKPYLNSLNTLPILFIHGTEDLLVPMDVFWKIWHNVDNCPKFAFITPFAHSSSLFSESLYSSFCQNFINNCPEQFWKLNREINSAP